jgi:starch-binding outer membrane protein, SusD/RagB family
MRSLTLTMAAAVALFAAACDGPLDVNPRASIPFDEALQTPQEMEAAIMGLYDGMQASDGGFGRNTVVFPDMYADVLDFTGTFPTDRQVAQRVIRAENVGVEAIWDVFYDVVNRANNVLASLSNIEDQVPAATLNRFHGEALFARSLAYFTLARFFGGVPLVTEPLWSLERDFQPARASLTEVYSRVQADLTEAIDLLPATTGRPYRATAFAARALLAKTHLEVAQLTDVGQCQLALTRLNQVINNGPFSLVDDYGDVFFRKGNAEMVFSLNYTVNDSNPLAFWFFAESAGGRLGWEPSWEYYVAMDAHGGDRFDASFGWDPDWQWFYGIKYFRIATGDDDVPVIRLADLYLLRAEANLCVGAPAATVRADINTVRQRAGVGPLPALTDRDDLIDALLEERLVELGMEGHRLFDLRRMGVAQDYLGIAEFQLLFPIPQRDMDTNTRLVQNPGY